LRVAFLTHYTALHGANRSLLALIDGLKIYGVISYVIAPAEGPITEALRTRGVAYLIVPMQPWVSSRSDSVSDRHPITIKMFGTRLYSWLRWRYNALLLLWGNIYLLPALIKQLKAWNVNIIYTNTSVIELGAMAACIMRRPHVWHIREFGDLDYGVDFHWGKNLCRYLIGRSDAAIAISEAVRSYHLANAKTRRTFVIYNGVASKDDFDRLSQITQANTTPVCEDIYTFALVGIIHPAKGQVEAVMALALVVKDTPRVRLLIVGSGNTEPLRKLAADLGVTNNLEFWGYVDDPYQAYQAADAVLMCSKYEAMGRVTAEAMAACRPVIGLDSGGTSEIIAHTRTGLLYRGGPVALADCMRQFVHNPLWARQLGENGWRLARERYTVEAYARSVYNVLYQF
jgi:glycosyltransferase involved in cell wall biosynthesis